MVSIKKQSLVLGHDHDSYGYWLAERSSFFFFLFATRLFFAPRHWMDHHSLYSPRKSARLPHRVLCWKTGPTTIVFKGHGVRGDATGKIIVREETKFNPHKWKQKEIAGCSRNYASVHLRKLKQRNMFQKCC